MSVGEDPNRNSPSDLVEMEEAEEEARGSQHGMVGISVGPRGSSGVETNPPPESSLAPSQDPFSSHDDVSDPIQVSGNTSENSNNSNGSEDGEDVEMAEREEDDESEDDLNHNFSDDDESQDSETSNVSDKEDGIDRVGAGADEKKKEGGVDEGNTSEEEESSSSGDEDRKPFYQDYTLPVNDNRDWSAITQEDPDLQLIEGPLPVEAREDQELIADLVERLEAEDQPNMVLQEETPDELFQRMQRAATRLEGVENAKFYSPCQDKFPKHSVLRTVAKMDQKTIGEFVRYAQGQHNAPDERIEPSLVNPKARTSTSIVEPSSRSIIVSVVKIQGPHSAIVTPVHVEVVAGKRFHLQFMHLTRGTYDLRSGKMLEIRELQLGDLLYVESIVPFNKDVRKPMVTKVEDVNKIELHYYWKVKGVVLLPRIMLKDKYARRFKSRGNNNDKFLCEDVEYPAQLDRNLKNDKDYKILEWMKVDVMMPMIQPGINVRDYKPKPSDEAEARNLFNSHRPIWNIPPTVLAARPLNDREAAKFKLGVNQFSCRGDAKQDDFYWLSTIVRIGVWARAAIANIYYDPRKYPSVIIFAEHNVYGDTFKIELTFPKHLPAKVVHWRRGTPVSVQVMDEYVTGIVMSALDYADEGFFVIIKITRNLQYALESYITRPVITYHQKQEVDDMIRSHIGKLRPPVYEPGQPAMEAVIAIHGGSRIVDTLAPRKKETFKFGPFTSTLDQGVVYSMLQDKGVPAFLLDCCFGAGKTTTMVAAMCKLISEQTSNDIKWYLFTGQSNGAVAQAVKAWMKLDLLKTIRVVRIITPANRTRIDTGCQTPFDLPVMLWEILREVFVRYNHENKQQNDLSRCVVRHLHNKQKLGRYRRIKNLALKQEIEKSYRKEPPKMTIIECFLIAYQPNILFGTTASIRQAFITNGYLANNKERVPVIMVDEASILARSSVLALAYTFPQSRFVFTGDVKQLPPHSEQELPKDLGFAVSGPMFETIINTNALPIVSVKECFRCPPQLTEIISKAFYKGTLVSKKRWNINHSLTKKIGFATGYPLKFINTYSLEEKEGTSYRNTKEALIAQKLVYDAIQRGVEPHQIMVLCYYLAQASLISALLPRNVRVSTVDAAQGSEYELVVILSTKSMDFIKSPFLDSEQRVTVAFSRATEGCVCLYNRKDATNSTAWKKLLNQVPEQEKLDAELHTRWNVSQEEVRKLDAKLKAAETIGHSVETIEHDEDMSRKRKPDGQDDKSLKLRK